MSYFLHKKSKKLIEVISKEDNVLTLKEFGSDKEKQIKSGLFNKLFAEASDEQVEEAKTKLAAAEELKIAKQQEREAKKAAKAKKDGRTPRAAKSAEKHEDSARFKELVEKHVIKNTYELLENGQEVHTAIIGLEGKDAATTLTYTSYVKATHNGFARTYVAFNGRKLTDYNNIGATVVSEDFAADFGMAPEDMAFLLITLRRATCNKHKEDYTVEEILKTKKAYAEKKKQEAFEKQKAAVKKKRDHAAALVEKRDAKKAEQAIKALEKDAVKRAEHAELMAKKEEMKKARKLEKEENAAKEAAEAPKAEAPKAEAKAALKK